MHIAEFLNFATVDILGQITIRWGAALCIAGWLAASLTSTYPPDASSSLPVGMIKSISRYGLMFLASKIIPGWKSLAEYNIIFK